MIFLILSAKGVFGMEPMKNQLWTDKPHNFLGLCHQLYKVHHHIGEIYYPQRLFEYSRRRDYALSNPLTKSLLCPLRNGFLDAAPLRCTPRTVTLLPRNSRLSGIHAPCWSFWTTPLNKPVKPIMCRGATWSAPLTGIPAVMRMNAILNNSITLPCERKGPD